jgi:flagellar biogenesis protein FliO
MKLLFAATAVFFSFLTLAAQPASALTTLKKIQVSGGDQIELQFDGKVNVKQIRTEFFNDIIQLSLNDVSVYPAKINSVSGMDLTKVFAYQYAPKLVRCRLTVKGKAESFQKRFKLKANGKSVVLSFGEGDVDQLTTTSAQANRAVAHGSEADQSPASRKGQDKAEVSAAQAGQASTDEAEERALLERVMKSAPAPAAAAAAPAPPKETTEAAAHPAAAKEEVKDTSKKRSNLTGGKPVPSPFRSLAILGLVMALFLGVAYLLKRFKGGELQSHKAFSGLLGKFAKIGIAPRPKMIEVLSNHYLGPKKSISVVKIGGRTLVLGVTQESINLITQLPSDATESEMDSVADDLALDDLGITNSSGATSASSGAGPSLFSSFLKTEKSKPASQPVTAAPASQAAQATTAPTPTSQSYSQASSNVRAQIKSRMEGMKPL